MVAVSSPVSRVGLSCAASPRGPLSTVHQPSLPSPADVRMGGVEGGGRAPTARQTDICDLPTTAAVGGQTLCDDSADVHAGALLPPCALCVSSRRGSSLHADVLFRGATLMLPCARRWRARN